MSEPTYRIDAEGKTITCLRCGRTSYNGNDVRWKYCGFCKEYHENITPEEMLLQAYPTLPWREPLPVVTSHGRFIACRFCIAMYGLSEQRTDWLPRNEAEFKKHMEQQHPEKI